jgi:ABC-2 type transport system ATP-binding protein
VDTDRPGDVTGALAAAGIWLTELSPVRRDLESVFLELTSGDTLGGPTEVVAR